MYYQPTQIFENDADTLGFDWGSIIGPAVGAGTNFGLSWLQSLGQGGQQGNSANNCGTGRVDGDGAIALCLDRMIPELMSVTAGMTASEKLPMYEQFLQFMQSEQFFDQRDSAHYLGNQIRQFRDELIPELRRLAALEQAAGTVTTVTDPATGQTVVIPTATSGLDTNTLLLIGGGALVLILLLKN